MIVYGVVTVNLHEQRNRAALTANTIAQNFGERIGIINTVLASMVGLHDISSEIENENLMRFSQEILSNAPYIRNLGRYVRISRYKRISYENKIRQNGNPEFQIAQLEEDGSYLPRLTRNAYFPISVAGPLGASPPEFIGTDLGALPGFSEQLNEISTSNTATTMSLPSQWPLGGDLIYVRPTYREDAAERPMASVLENTAGGVWLTLDIAHLFEGLSEAIDEFNAVVYQVQNGEKKLVYTRDRKIAQTRLLSDWVSSNSIEDTWTLSPSTKLVVSLEQPVGFTIPEIAISSLTSLLVCLLALQFTSQVISRQKAASEKEESLKKVIYERAKAEKTLNAVRDAIITLDPQFKVVHVNRAASLQFNISPKKAVGKPLNLLAQFHNVSDLTAILDIPTAFSALSSNGKLEFDVVPAGMQEEDFIYSMSLTSSHDHTGKTTGNVMVLRDMSQERLLSRKLAYQANYDALTGCTNRHYFENALEKLIGQMEVTGHTHTLCYLDVDQFKVVNDTCGHSAGDQLLIELAQVVRLQIREQDILSRLGGDEFGVILVAVDKQEADVISQRIFQAFQTFNFTQDEYTFSITASIGVVHIDKMCATSKDIMSSADIACYEAKDSGRNSMSVFSRTNEGMVERSEELTLLPRLQAALKNNEFRLFVQAVASLDQKFNEPPITHFEFLLRLRDSTGQEISPWQFIKAAERYDLMRDIDRWVISNSLQFVARHSTDAGADCSFSINLSGQSAADPTLKTFIQEQMTLHKVDPAKIWFELTETAAITHFAVAVDLIDNIRSTGAKVALDDFGSGLSSYGYLKNLSIDVIKIDGQFVKEIVGNPVDREMVRAIHRVAQAMNVVTVAEFVENQAIVDELIKIGVNYAQGYHYGKPMPVDEAIALLEHAKAA